MAEVNVKTVTRNRIDLATAWTAANPVLADGELGIERDTGKFKFGDGATAWNLLGYAGGGSGGDSVIVNQAVPFIKEFAFNDPKYLPMEGQIIDPDGYSPNLALSESVNFTQAANSRAYSRIIEGGGMLVGINGSYVDYSLNNGATWIRGTTVSGIGDLYGGSFGKDWSGNDAWMFISGNNYFVFWNPSTKAFYGSGTIPPAEWKEDQYGQYQGVYDVAWWVDRWMVCADNWTYTRTVSSSYWISDNFGCIKNFVVLDGDLYGYGYDNYSWDNGPDDYHTASYRTSFYRLSGSRIGSSVAGNYLHLQKKDGKFYAFRYGSLYYVETTAITTAWSSEKLIQVNAIVGSESTWSVSLAGNKFLIIVATGVNNSTPRYAIMKSLDTSTMLQDIPLLTYAKSFVTSGGVILMYYATVYLSTPEVRMPLKEDDVFKWYLRVID